MSPEFLWCGGGGGGCGGGGVCNSCKKQTNIRNNQTNNAVELAVY